MFGIGSTELLVILLVALIVLGPKSLSGLSRTLGKVVGEFRRVSTDFQRTLNAEAAAEELKEQEQKKAAEASAVSEAKPSSPADGDTANYRDTVDARAREAVEKARAAKAARESQEQVGSGHASPEADADPESISRAVPEDVSSPAVTQNATASHTAPGPDGIPQPPDDSPLGKALAAARAEAEGTGHRPGEGSGAV